MRKSLPLLVITLLIAVSFAPVKGQDGAAPALEVSDQLSLNGMLTITHVNSPRPGFVVIRAAFNGAPGPVIGIAPVAAGPTENLSVMIDVGRAVPTLYAFLHVDDNTAGVFENEKNPNVDRPITVNGQPLMATFKWTAVRVYDQMIKNNTVSIAAVVSENGGWAVIYADDNGQPGAVLGQALFMPGTTPNVVVPLTAESAAPILWVMLHIDDNTVEDDEFGQVEDADAPLMVHDQIAALAFNSTITPTVMNAAGMPMAFVGDQLPSIQVSSQPITGDTGLVVDSVFSVGPSWIDVHADTGLSLGVAPVTNGDHSAVTVPFAQEKITSAPALVQLVLHTDDNQSRVYEYMMVMGADLPVIANGQILTVPVTIGAGGDQGMAPTATSTAK